MAQKTVVTLYDDLDGSTEHVETVSFALDGQTYDIDLSRVNAGTLREVLADGPALDPLVGEVGGGVVGPGRAELTAAMGSSSVVMIRVLGQHHPQVPFAEDQHPVGDLGPGGEHEPFGIGVRPRAPGRDLHRLDARAGQDRVEGRGELPGPVADQEPEARGAVAEVHQEVPRHCLRPDCRASFSIVDAFAGTSQ
jgi:hypothetical protein